MFVLAVGLAAGVLGGVIGTGSSIMLPLSVPIFTAYGLTKGAFLSTEAMSSLAVMISKVATFHELGALPLPATLHGLVIGASVMAGSFVGKRIVQRMSPAVFDHPPDGLLPCSGLSHAWDAPR